MGSTQKQNLKSFSGSWVVVAALAGLMLTACASTNVGTLGAAKRVTANVNDLPAEQINARHEALQVEYRSLQKRAVDEVERGMYRMAHGKYDQMHTILVQDVKLLTELSTRTQSKKNLAKIAKALQSADRELNQVERTLDLLRVYTRK